MWCQVFCYCSHSGCGFIATNLSDEKSWNRHIGTDFWGWTTVDGWAGFLWACYGGTLQSFLAYHGVVQMDWNSSVPCRWCQGLLLWEGCDFTFSEARLEMEWGYYGFKWCVDVRNGITARSYHSSVCWSLRCWELKLKWLSRCCGRTAWPQTLLRLLDKEVGGVLC